MRRACSRGGATAGAVIEVNNLTTLPTGNGVVEDGVEVARAGADGRFCAQLKNANAGDVVQVQIRQPCQPVTTALQLRVDAARTQFDKTAPMVRTGRLRVVDSSGTINISTRTRQPVTEPDALVRFKNARTGDQVDVVGDVFGRVATVSLPGIAGDRVEVLASDGSVAIDKVHASTTLDISAPPLPSQRAPLLNDSRFVKLLPLTGPVFLAGGPGFGRQGSIGNCPVPAACVALAAVDADAVKHRIADNNNGTCTVTFHPQGGTPVEIVVDNQVWGSGNRPKYGTAESDGANGIERWFPLVEKAYAAWVGDYEILGKGTSVGKVLGELTGRPTREVWTNVSGVDDVWRAASRAAVDKLPMAAGTYGSSESARHRRVREPRVLDPRRRREKRRALDHAAQPVGRGRCNDRPDRPRRRRRFLNEGRRLLSALSGAQHQLTATRVLHTHQCC